MKARQYTEEQFIASAQRRGSVSRSQEALPQARDERRHLLQVEGQIRWTHVSDLKRLKGLEEEN